MSGFVATGHKQATVVCHLPFAESIGRHMSTAEPQDRTGEGVEQLPLTVYSAASPLRYPLQLTGEILADVWRCRELIWILFTRDLKAQYRQSYLGFVWIFVPIISTTLIWVFLNSMRVIKVADTPIPYPAYVMIGSMIWGVFAASVNEPLTAFNAGRDVFTKLKVSPEIFILSGVGRVVFDLMIRLLVLVPVFVVLKIIPASTAWLFPIGLGCTVLIGVSVGVLIIPIGSLYTDVNRMVAAALPFGMYLAPVVYPPPTGGWAGTLVQWNPLTAVVVTTRDWLTLGHSSYASAMVITAVLALIALVLGLIIFRVVLPHLIERMGM